MEEQKIVTGKMIVEMTIGELKAINVPVDLIDSVGQNLSRAYNNLCVLRDAMEKNEAEEAMKQQEIPEIQILPVEENPEDIEATE